MTLTVSVLLPNYNHARFLERSLQALANQVRAPDEIIVVDDASTDDSVAIISNMLGTVPNLRLIRNPENLGVNRSINRALAAASGDYVVCTAADDWLAPNFLETMIDAIERHPGTRLCISQYVEYLEAEDRTVVHGPDSERGCWYTSNGVQFFSPESFCRLLDRRFVWLPINGALLHSNTLRGIGAFDPALKWHADWFATYTIAIRHGFLVVPEPLSAFRVAAGSYSGVGMRNRKQQRDVCTAIYSKLAGPDFADVGAAMRRHPAAFSPFIRYVIEGLCVRPRDWPYLGALAWWWLREAGKGRRPGFLRDYVDAWRQRLAIK